MKIIILLLFTTLSFGMYHRQTDEGFHLTSKPELKDVPWLAAQNIKVVLSLVKLDTKTRSKFTSYGINVIYAPMGDTFKDRHVRAIEKMFINYTAKESLIHCQHGVDRTGVVMAYILTRFYHYDLSDAFYAMVDPHAKHIVSLCNILNEYGIHRCLTLSNPITSKYAVFGKKGWGMKAFYPEYKNLIRTTINHLLPRKP